MAFNSSILKSNSIIKENINASSSIAELVENSNDDSYIYNLLEFNDSIHDIEISNNISYYKSLAENCNNTDLVNVNESIIGNIVERLSKIIESIIKFVKDIARKISSLSIFGKSRYNNFFRMSIKDATGFWATNPSEERTINLYYYPDINQIDSQKFRASLNNIVSELERVCDNKSDKAGTSERSREMAYKTLAKMIDKHVVVDTNDGIFDSMDQKEYMNNIIDPGTVTSSKLFNEFIRSNMCIVHQKSCNMNQWYKYFLSMKNRMHDVNIYAKKASEFKYDLERAKKIVSNAVINTDEQKKYADELIAQLTAITTSYTSFIFTIAKYENMNFDYHTKIFERHVLHKHNVDMNESGMIHGEKFDSDTLFDNEDVRDFNRTEWLDLNLTVECYELKYDMMETKRRIALQEANIMSDDQPNKFGRLIAMREAEEKKLGDKFKDTIERIRQFLNKFMENIKNRSSEMSAYIQKNMTFINKPIKIREIRSKGDILAGMYRVQQKINIIPYNYESMKDDLKDKETFFKNKILPNMKNTSQYAKRKLEWNENNTTITEYCKVYYGASMPEDKYPKCEFTTQDIEVNKNNIIKFLNQPNNAFSCKSDLDALENESRKVARSEQRQDNNTQNTTAQQTNPNNAEAKQESMYYSELYQTWFTEAEIEMAEQPTDQNNDNNNSNNNEEAKAYKVYMDCYKDIILAKMTAAEFIFAELSQIINAHTRSYMSAEQKKSEVNQNVNNSTQQPAPEKK